MDEDLLDASCLLEVLRMHRWQISSFEEQVAAKGAGPAMGSLFPGRSTKGLFAAVLPLKDLFQRGYQGLAGLSTRGVCKGGQCFRSQKCLAST